MRSKLFVPGSRPELFDKALRSQADAISFDLEDAVSDSRKADARVALGELLRSSVVQRARAAAKIIIVRVNAFDTPWFADDIASIVMPGIDLINLPKPRGVHDVRAAAVAIEHMEHVNDVTVPIKMLINIESPAALQLARRLAIADPRVAGLQLGLGDLFEPLGIARRESIAVSYAMCAVRVAAGAAGVFACDAAFADIRDSAGFRAEAELARRLGFVGKSCIHPSQVAIANEVFRPTEKEIDRALKILEAAREACVTGTGAYIVDGQMIDRPFIERARGVVAHAIRLGLLAESAAPAGVADSKVK
ncbi:MULTISPECIES: HpcH/HpaI aldolase/citrate lyase family protein [Burkholderia]|uniref:HpcH/HpaI aldolase/citrate lyase family protein n=1 Tax=Burkholderia TaxID=32008 RepID=UPI0008422B5C|nr:MULTISPECIES: CoA ester lyase [unclassified Burkholderia]AOK31876.1 citryl-CoA lyase [Burkholderia sp. Bp7605]